MVEEAVYYRYKRERSQSGHGQEAELCHVARGESGVAVRRPKGTKRAGSQNGWTIQGRAAQPTGLENLG